MSYDIARKCLADMQRYAPAKTKPIEYDLAAALVNLADAIQADMAETRRQLAGLREMLEDIQRRSR